jgi:O-antigen ligase
MQKNMETSFVRFLKKTTEYLGYLFVFILPWQVKLIFRPAETNYSEMSLYFSQALLLLILIFFLWVRFKEKESEDEDKYLVYTLAALELFILVSVFFAPDKLLAFYRYFIFLTGLSLFFIIRSGTAARSYQDSLFNKFTLFYSLLAGIFLQALLGIYQFLTQSTFACKYLGLAAHNPSTLGTAVIETANGRWLRAYGGLDHPNILGGVLAMGLILAAYLLAKKKMLNTPKQVWSSIFLFVFYFISLYALFFTFSRAAWLALLVGLIALLIIFIINKDKWIISRFIALVFFSAILVSLLAAPFQDLLRVRIDAETRLEQKSISERQDYLIQAKNILQKNFLFGVGVGNYNLAVGLIDSNKKAAWEYQPVHNAFLLLWAETGIFSSLAFLALFFFLIKNNRREVFAWAIIAPFS